MGNDHIRAFVDDLIVVAKEPLQHLEVLASKFKLRNVADSPEFFLGSNWTNENNKMMVSTEACIKECIRRFEEEHGTIRLESVPAPAKSHSLNHSKSDNSPLLHHAHLKFHQSIIDTY